MNILFYHGDETCPTAGGIQRTTACIADGLTRQYGHKCYNIYSYPEPYPADFTRYQYVDSRHIPQYFAADDVAQAIRDWDIDVVVNQQMVEQHTTLYDGAVKSGRDCKVFYFHHNTPRRLWDTSFASLIKGCHSHESILTVPKQLVKMVIFPIWRKYKNDKTLAKNAADYKSIYAHCDKFVVLSEQFFPELLEMTHFDDTSRLAAIPNMLSFDTTLDSASIPAKQKRLLLVARLCEFPKRVSWALKVWDSIARDKEFADWEFDIVGHGEDSALLQKMIKERHIPRVNMHGRQESEKYYERSSIFIMTSIREGWGMTLTEASQKGCVPIAFDSFASVRDIITDGENGVLVTPFKLKEFASKLCQLMRDTDRREAMARKAIEMSQRYTRENILKKWNELLTEK